MRVTMTSGLKSAVAACALAAAVSAAITLYPRPAGGQPAATMAARTGADRVTKANELLNAAAAEPQGCSGFVCRVLGIDLENADSLMGDSPTPVGGSNTNDYDLSKLQPGDVVGWKSSDGPADSDGHGHVAIYIGDGTGNGKQFIDVPGVGKPPRSLHGYGKQMLYKSSK